MKPKQPEPVAAARPAGRRFPVLALVVLALLAAGCGREPPRHRLEGTYIVHGIYPQRNYGAPCSAAHAGYPDIRQGTTVVVKDGTGAPLGTATLEGGTLRKGPLRGRDDDCIFTFSLRVPERDDYAVAVGRRGVVKFTRSELERANWRADLTIGAYTMFGGI